MEAALKGLSSTAKHSAIKEAVVQAQEALKDSREKGDVPIPYVREKCLAAIELAFDHGNDKTAHHAVEGVQALLRDQRFHSVSIEHPQHNLPTQVLHSMTGIAQWNQQLQCHCLTLLVEMICSSTLKVALQEVEETVELCMRIYGGSREESVRVSARAAVSQAITSYFSNRYAAAEEQQDLIAVYLDVTKLLEAHAMKLDQMTTANDQSVVVFDAANALLAAQPISIASHQPFVNLLWEKLCPLMIRLIGVPDKNVTTTTPITVSVEEPVGQGQMSKFPLSVSVIANPEATRSLYQILEQLIRIMAVIPSVTSVLEAVFHKAFLFPKVEHRGEAIKIIRKIVSDPRRIADLISTSVRTKSLSLWRMVVVCLLESANPNFELSIDAIRTCGSLLQGILDLSRSTHLLDQQTKDGLREMFGSLEEATTSSFSTRSDTAGCSPRPSTETRVSSDQDNIDTEEPDDEISEKLRRLTQKFGMERVSEDSTPRPILSRRSTEYDETSEKVTAQKFADALLDKIPEWEKLRSTLTVDDAILEFAAGFYSDFSAVHNEVFKAKSKVQQEFLNTDAIYLTAYAALSLVLRGEAVATWAKFRDAVLASGCIVYVSESWLEKVYGHLKNSQQPIAGALREVIGDYDGVDRRRLSDVERLQSISQGQAAQPYEERLAARWFITAAWDSLVKILSTFLGIKERRKARPKILEGIEHAINGVQALCTVALELELADRCGWIFENLVESACDVDELRAMATSEDTKRWAVISRIDLLSIQMVLDNAFVAIHAPECWKHVIRCTEFIWELEKCIYGALCYEKPARFSFGRKKVEKVQNKAEEGMACADRSVERAIGDGPVDRDAMNRALAVLIAKVDRVYDNCGHELALRSLRELLVALVGASENRILWSGFKAVSLSPPIALLTRVSDILTSMPNRPLVHQMMVWPIVGAHFVQISCSEDESRNGVNALSESASAMIVAESNGMCFNQMLLSPFQAIVCSDSCSSETREQLVGALADYVRLKSDNLGSGWKPLFGTLRAVRTDTVENASVHWTVLDVIATYLKINNFSVLSWSLPDCFPCIVHFLQSTDSESTDIEDQLSEAALRLVQPTFTVLRNLHNTPHIPNHNLLHRADLRAAILDEVEPGIECQKEASTWLPPLSSTIDPVFFAHPAGDPPPMGLDSALSVPCGPLPWLEKLNHETASIELLVSLFEQLSGAVATAPRKVQSPLMKSLQHLIMIIKETEFGLDTAAYCVSALLLTHTQKWLRRHNEDAVQNIKQAIGTCTDVVLKLIDGSETSSWSTRLLSDATRLAVECSAQRGDLSKVGAACLRHLCSLCSKFDEAQWSILEKALWDATAATLYPTRLLASLFVADSQSETGDLGEVLLNGNAPLTLKQRMLAQQVFLIDMQRRELAPTEADDSESEGEPMAFILYKDGEKIKLPIDLVISSLIAHQLILQLVASFLLPAEVPSQLVNIATQPIEQNAFSRLSSRTRAMLFYCLDASFQVALDIDNRQGFCQLLSKSLGFPKPNLYKQLISAATVKLNALYHLQKTDRNVNSQLCRCIDRLVAELQRFERASVARRVAAAREMKEEKLEFLLVEHDGQKLYKVVSEKEINNTLADYNRQRPLTTQPRRNPFTDATATKEEETPEEKTSIESLRLLAYRDICLLPVRLALSEPKPEESARLLLPTVRNLVLASPDLSVRSVAVDLLDLFAGINSDCK